MTTMAARNISVTIGERTILDGVEISVEPGRVTGLIGPNGAGKTTLVRTLVGLQKISCGEIWLDGEAATKVPRETFARRVAYLPQGAEIHWPLTVERLVALGRLPHLTAFQRPADHDHAAILRAMEETDVTHLADRTVTTLSGGERGRVMIARALAGEPQILLADEPVAALDPYHQLHVMALLSRTAQTGAAVLVVLHDLVLAARYCAHLVLVDGGKVVTSGPPREVLSEDNLRNVYRVRGRMIEHPDGGFIVPWDQVKSNGEDGNP
ncbi:MAG: ABC transporter ATP-binding protein [Rhodospirillales bacterium]|nr:ABC transporter ATP-binding protein [Rhodospirillales bacterium]